MFSTWARPMLLLGVIVTYHVLLVSFIQYRLSWTPPVQPASAPAHVFSEERAMAHVWQLADVIGHRQVSTPGRAAAARYLLEQGHEIARLAAERGLYNVEVEAQQVSGAVNMNFVNQNFTNVYLNLTNIVLALTPRTLPEGSHPPGLLLASHYDSGVSSVGAADDAAHVGVMLELARALVSLDTAPLAPLVLLFTGGEETISQAAHGFMSLSRQASTLGAFINLESIGSGGLPYVFQHTHGWVAEAYARGAPHARGTRVAQDIFDLGVIPADSDFRMFSSRHYGTLPGLDIAFLRDSTTYHTKLDVPSALRPGGIQEIGEDLMGAVFTIAAKLADPQGPAKATLTKAPSAGAEAEGAGSQPEAGGAVAESRRSKEDYEGRAVYHDLCGLVMLTMPDTSLERATYSVILLLIASLFLVHEGKEAWSTVSTASHSMLHSIVLSVLSGAGLSALRVATSSIPMIWYANQWVAYATFAPFALSAILLPWQKLVGKWDTAVPPREMGQIMMQQVHGVGATLSLLALFLGWVGLLGFASMFCACAWLCLLVGHVINAPSLSWWRATLCLALATPVLVGIGSLSGAYVPVLMERMSITGYVSSYLADAIVGGLVGFSVLGYTGGALLPLLAAALPQGRRAHTLMTLLCTGLLLSAITSFAVQPYSAAAPKRLMVLHLHRTEPAPSARLQAAATAADKTPGGSCPYAAAAAAAGAHSVPHDVVPDFPHPPVPHLTAADAASEDTPLPPTESTTLDADSCGPSAPCMRVESTLFVLGGTDSTPMSAISLRAPDSLFATLTRWPVPVHGSDYAANFPLDVMLEKVGVPAPPSAQPLLAESELPYIALRRVEQHGQDLATQRRLHLALYLPRPAWVVLNITGPLRNWSVTPTLHPTAIKAEGARSQHIIRLASEAEDPVWDFWLDGGATLPEGCGEAGEPEALHDAAEVATCEVLFRPLQLELTVSLIDESDVLGAFVRALPEWLVSTFHAVTYQSVFEF